MSLKKISAPFYYKTQRQRNKIFFNARGSSGTQFTRELACYRPQSGPRTAFKHRGGESAFDLEFPTWVMGQVCQPEISIGRVFCRIPSQNRICVSNHQRTSIVVLICRWAARISDLSTKQTTGAEYVYRSRRQSSIRNFEYYG